MNPFIINQFRFRTFPNDTLSTIHLPGGEKFYSLENGVRVPKVPKETRIPAGMYEVLFRHEGGFFERYSKVFNGNHPMLWLQDVPDFEWVYYHIGNYNRDTDGCILTGNGYQINDTQVKTTVMVTGSKEGYTQFYGLVSEQLKKGVQVYTNIIDVG